MSENYQKLFTPFSIGSVTSKNRLLMGPMGASFVFDSAGLLTDRGIEYLTERAKGGWGMIYTGVQLVDKEVDPVMGASPLSNPMGYYNRAMLLNERVAAYGTKVFAEIGLGVGRNYPGFYAPSAVECYNYPQMTSLELSKDQIAKKRDQIIQAAALMQRSGYAGVDIHTIHWGYLLDQFVLSITNHRTDEYGGSLDNRLRLCREIIEGIRQTCGENFPVTIGLGVKSFIKALNKASLTGEDEAGRTIEEAVEIAKKLEEMGYDAILTDTGIYDSFYYACPPSYMPKGYALPLYEQIKQAVNIPVIARSRMNDPDLCVKALEKGQADAFMMARQTLADPDFPRKLESGKPEKIRYCIGCNIGCIGSVIDTGKDCCCAVNPRACREIYYPSKKAMHPRKIAVVGGGVAGMEAARAAAEYGHTVELYEASDHLGGQLVAAGAHETKKEISQLREWYISELKSLEVPVHLNTTFTPEMADEKFDTVILATGAVSVMPKSIKGIEKGIPAIDLLEGKAAAGQRIVVVGGGMVGCETATELAKEGKTVTLVEALPDILSGEFVPTQHKMMLRDMLEHDKVTVITGKKLVEITDHGAVVEGESEKEELAADTVVVCIGRRPNPSLAPALQGHGVEIYEIGEAKRMGNVLNSVHEAFEVVYNFE